MICVNQYHTHLCGEVSEADIGKKYALQVG